MDSYDLYEFTFKHEIRLINFIQNHEYRKTFDVLDNIYRINSGKSILRQKAMFEHIIQVVLNFLKSSCIDPTNVFGTGSYTVLSGMDSIYKPELVKDYVYKCIDLTLAYLWKGKQQPDHNMVKFVDDNINNDISLDSVADKMNVSIAYVSKRFKKLTGQKYIDYVHEKRIEMARKELLNNDVKISEISEKVGFYSVGTFIRVFKKIEGMTPSEYRKIEYSISQMY